MEKGFGFLGFGEREEVCRHKWKFGVYEEKMFNGLLDEVDKRLALDPPQDFIDALKNAISTEARATTPEVYVVDVKGVVGVLYSSDYARWMTKQGIFNISYNKEDKRLTFSIRRVLW